MKTARLVADDPILVLTAPLRESIGPYSRFIRAEGDKLRTTEQELQEIGSELASLRARINKRAA